MVELLTVLIASVAVTLLLDLPMQEVKSILFDGGKQNIRRACLTNQQ
jgi:hypothetical protein